MVLVFGMKEKTGRNPVVLKGKSVVQFLITTAITIRLAPAAIRVLVRETAGERVVLTENFTATWHKRVAVQTIRNVHLCSGTTGEVAAAR